MGKIVDDPYKIAYYVFTKKHWVDANNKQKTNWVTIGMAYSKSDGSSITVFLDALPINGRFVMHRQKKKTDGRTTKQRRIDKYGRQAVEEKDKALYDAQEKEAEFAKKNLYKNVDTLDIKPKDDDGAIYT